MTCEVPDIAGQHGVSVRNSCSSNLKIMHIVAEITAGL